MVIGRRSSLRARLAVAVVVGAFAGLGIRLAGLYPLRIASNSMAPTVRAGDIVVVARLSTGDRKKLAREDIAVFRFAASPSGLAIKRIVAIPGDTVEVSRASIRINARAIAVQPISGHRVTERATDQPRSSVIPADRYFILGDNSASSIDSRSIGLLDGESIVGRVLVTLPLSALWHRDSAP